MGRGIRGDGSVMRRGRIQGFFAMFIPRIFRPSGISELKARGRRSQSEHLFQLELLENRTPLSAGLDVGFAAALISKPPQFGLANVSLSPPIDLTIQATIVRSSPTVAGSAELSEGSFPNTLLPAATGDSLSPPPGNPEQVVSIAVDVQIVAPHFPPPQPTAALESGTSPTWFGSAARVESAPLPLTHAAVPTFDLRETNLGVMVSSEGRSSVPALDQTTEHGGLWEIALARDLYVEGPETMGFNSPPPPPYVAKQQLSEADLNTINDPDVSVLGSLMSPDLHQSSSALMTTESATGRSSGSGLTVISTGPSTHLDLSPDSSGNGWMSYVATGGSVPAEAQSSSFRGDVVSASDETTNEPSTPASITAGALPLSILLSGPDAPAQTGSDRLEQVAELIPPEESSLALIATLWTVSADSPMTQPPGDLKPVDGGMESGAPLASPPSWTVYVIGLNEAFEQSQRDVGQAFLSRPRRPIEEARGRAALDEGLPWQGPIVPAAERGSLEKVRGGSRTGSPTAAVEATHLRGSNEARPVPSGRAEVAPAQSDDGQTVAVASLPTISAVSALGLIAGWFWTQRQRLAHFRLGTKR
jgi:hypothetical protein